MRELLYKLEVGVLKKELSKSQKKFVQLLEKIGVVMQKEAGCSLVKNMFLAKVDVPKNNSKIAFLVPIIKTKNKRDLVIKRVNLKGATSGDLCICEDKNGIKVRFVLEEEKPPLFGVIEKQGEKFKIVEYFTKRTIVTTSKQKSLKTLPLGTIVEIEQKKLQISKILGNISEPKFDELVVLGRYARSEAFSKDAKEQALSYGEEVDASIYPNRKDLRELDFITIDPKTAKDFDDAIYFDCQKNELFVAIADVSEYVREFSHLDKEARKRGFSIYFPHKSIPMLPKALSENLCSLKEGKDRLVFVFKITLTMDAKVKNYELFEGIICSRKRFTYEEIDEIYKTKKTKFKFLFSLEKLVKILRTHRLENGFDFSEFDMEFVLDENLCLKEILKHLQTFSHQLVEECMLLANICASTYFKKGIFRVHEKIDVQKMSKILDELALKNITIKKSSDIHKQIINIQKAAKEHGMEEEIDKMIIKSFKRAIYSFENVGHFGLGFSSYTHFTSPIRRYSDLVLHRLLKAIIQDDTNFTNYITQDLKTSTKIISYLEEQVNKIQWDYEDLIYARWAKKNEGKVFDGLIDAFAKDKNCIVKLSNGALGARVFCLTLKSCEKFDKVRVRILDGDILGAKIYGEILDV